MIKAAAPLAGLIAALFFTQMNCGRGSDVSRSANSKPRPVQSMPKNDKPPPMTTPASDSPGGEKAPPKTTDSPGGEKAPPKTTDSPGGEKAPYTLLQALSTTNAYAKERLAARVDASGTRYGFWDIEPDGKFHLTEWAAFGLFKDILSTAAGSNPSWNDLPRHQKPPRSLHGQIVQKGEPEFDRAEPSDIGNLVAIFRCTLTIQDQKDIEGRFYLYKATAEDLPVHAMFVPGTDAEGDYALVIADDLLSSEVSGRSMTRSDFDGDGVTDTAFIAERPNGCGEKFCPLYWVEMLSTRFQRGGLMGNSVLLYPESLLEMKGACSKLKDIARTRQRLRWKMRAVGFNLSISMSSSGCKINWHSSIGEDGRKYLRFDPPIQ